MKAVLRLCKCIVNLLVSFLISSLIKSFKDLTVLIAFLAGFGTLFGYLDGFKKNRGSLILFLGFLFIVRLVTYEQKRMQREAMEGILRGDQ